MFSSDRHFAETLRDKALLAAEALVKAKTPETMAPPLRRLIDAASKTTHLSTMSQLQDAQRVVMMQVLYHPPIAPHLLQRFEHQTDDYSLVVPLDRGQRIDSTLVPTRKVSHLTSMYVGSAPSDEALVVFPFTLRFVAHWFENIDGPMKSFQYTPTRPAHPFGFNRLEELTAEGHG